MTQETYQQEAERMYPGEQKEMGIPAWLRITGSRKAHITARQMGQKEIAHYRAIIDKLREGLDEVIGYCKYALPDFPYPSGEREMYDKWKQLLFETEPK